MGPREHYAVTTPATTAAIVGRNADEMSLYAMTFMPEPPTPDLGYISDIALGVCMYADPTCDWQLNPGQIYAKSASLATVAFMEASKKVYGAIVDPTQLQQQMAT